MEALAIVFVIFIFTGLLLPEKKKPKPTGPEQLADGVKAFAVELLDTIKGKGGNGNGGSSGKKGGLGSPLSVVLITVLLGFLITFLL